MACMHQPLEKATRAAVVPAALWARTVSDLSLLAGYILATMASSDSSLSVARVWCGVVSSHVYIAAL